MNTSIEDDLGGKKIEINKMEPLPLTSNENLPQPNADKPPSNFMKKAYSKLVNNIKTLATKKENQNQETPKTEDVTITSSQDQQEDIAPKTCKDKVADAIINKVEVQKNKKLTKIKALPKAKVIENLLGEVIIKGIVKRLIHNKKLPMANKEKKTVLFFGTSTLAISVSATLSLHVLGAGSSCCSWDEDMLTSSAFGGS